MANNPNAKDNLQPFKKGDPRINRNGRPKSFDAWRKLLQSIMDEPATDGHGDPIIIGADKDGNGGHIATNAEMFARDWMKDRKGRRDFAANVYGKPKEEIDLRTPDGLKVVIEYADNKGNTPPLTSGADKNKAGTEEA
jgi:hypothetical protein